MTVALDILRGFAFYVALIGAGLVLGHLILPPFPRLMASMVGGGVVLLIVVIVLLANIEVKT